MGDGRDDERGATGGERSSTELLDLVRAAEDEAHVSARDRISENVIDVGNDAIDAPPSHPAPPVPVFATPAAARGTPPVVGILLLFGLVAAVLALLAR